MSVGLDGRQESRHTRHARADATSSTTSGLRAFVPPSALSTRTPPAPRVAAPPAAAAPRRGGGTPAQGRGGAGESGPPRRMPAHGTTTSSPCRSTAAASRPAPSPTTAPARRRHGSTAAIPSTTFLRFMIPYRMHGGIIRQTIASQTDPGRKARYQARYAWLKTRWFGNAECYRDATATLGPPRQPSARRACDGCARASGAERAAGAPPGRATGVRPTARPSQAS